MWKNSCVDLPISRHQCLLWSDQQSPYSRDCDFFHLWWIDDFIILKSSNLLPMILCLLLIMKIMMTALNVVDCAKQRIYDERLKWLGCRKILIKMMYTDSSRMPDLEEERSLNLRQKMGSHSSPSKTKQVHLERRLWYRKWRWWWRRCRH